MKSCNTVKMHKTEILSFIILSHTRQVCLEKCGKSIFCNETVLSNPNIPLDTAQYGKLDKDWDSRWLDRSGSGGWLFNI